MNQGQDWSQWPYVQRVGHPDIAQFTPWGYPTLGQTDAYKMFGPPPRPKQVNHAIHLIATIITMGFWIPVWLGVMVVTHNRNTRADVEYWARIQSYYEWERKQRALNQGG